MIIDLIFAILTNSIPALLFKFAMVFSNILVNVQLNEIDSFTIQKFRIIKLKTYKFG